jgi:hypothetical protein
MSQESSEADDLNAIRVLTTLPIQSGSRRRDESKPLDWAGIAA